MKKLFFTISILLSFWLLGCSCCTLTKDDSLNIEVSDIKSYVNLMPKTDNKNRYDFYLLANLNISYTGATDSDSLKADVESLQIGETEMPERKISVVEIKEIEKTADGRKNLSVKLKVSSRLMKTTEIPEKLNSIIKFDLGGMSAKVKFSDIEVQKVH